MNYELEIAFDFKNSKEYFVRYEPIELTDSEKIPEKLKNKKLYVFAFWYFVYNCSILCMVYKQRN